MGTSGTGKMARVSRGILKLLDWFQDLLFLALRGWWGYQFAITGWGKLQNLERVTGYFTTLGIPAPKLNAMMAGSTECFGGALLAVGLVSRPAAVALAGTMSVAYATAHREELLGIFQKPDAFIAADPFMYLVVALLVLAHGPGMISLDAVVARILRDRLSESTLALFVGRNTARRLIDCCATEETVKTAL